MQQSPTAVITGASQGLGLALARALHADGWNLVIDARRADRLEAAARELRADGSAAEVVAVPGDVTDADHLRALAKAARELGDVRAVVNNASTLGASPLPPLDRIEPDVLRRVVDVNVVAPVALVQELVTDLGPGGAIVNVTSDAAVEPYESGAATAPARPRSSMPPVCSRSSIPSGACSWSIRATCAPRCIRTHSPARTSPTFPDPRGASRPSSRSSPAIARAGDIS